MQESSTYHGGERGGNLSITAWGFSIRNLISKCVSYVILVLYRSLTIYIFSQCNFRPYNLLAMCILYVSLSCMFPVSVIPVRTIIYVRIFYVLSLFISPLVSISPLCNMSPLRLSPFRVYPLSVCVRSPYMSVYPLSVCVPYPCISPLHVYPLCLLPPYLSPPIFVSTPFSV